MVLMLHAAIPPLTAGVNHVHTTSGTYKIDRDEAPQPIGKGLGGINVTVSIADASKVTQTQTAGYMMEK